MDGDPAGPQPPWRSPKAYRIPDWVEPVLIVSILFTSMFLTRNRHVSLFGGRSAGYTPLPLHENDRPRQQNGNGHRHADHRERLSLSALSSPSISSASSASSRRRSRRSYDPYPPKARTVLGCFTIQTPNSSRFAGHFHSRILQKFPFLIEMFYWVLTFLFYRMTAVGAEAWYGGSSGHDGGAGSSAASISVERSNILARTGLPADGGPPVDPSVRRLWDAAQAHGVWLLETEARYWWRWILFGGHRDATGTERWAEWRLQQWFLAGMQAGDWRGIWLSVLNRSYALIHIPGTVGFIAYYYGTAPTHARFCTVRRALSLLNLFAFSVFILWPCMPPRLLPAEYGFVDTVNGEDAESVWMSGNYVNKLAAMPSMHFGYAACIGAVFIYESAVVHRLVRLLSIGWRVVGGATLARKVRGVAGRATRRCLPAGRKSMRLVPSDGNLEAAALSETSSESDSEEQRRTRSGEIRTTASPSVLDAHGNPIPLSELPLPYAEQESHRAFHWSDLLRFAFGVFYPSWILLTIVATANHYVADAVVALVGVGVAFACNRVLLNFLPAEDYLLWILRLDKPEPTTGWKRRERMVEEELKRREAERR